MQPLVSVCDEPHELNQRPKTKYNTKQSESNEYQSQHKKYHHDSSLFQKQNIVAYFPLWKVGLVPCWSVRSSTFAPEHDNCDNCYSRNYQQYYCAGKTADNGIRRTSRKNFWMFSLDLCNRQNKLDIVDDAHSCYTNQARQYLLIVYHLFIVHPHGPNPCLISFAWQAIKRAYVTAYSSLTTL